jgi:hypothetical protein
MSELKPSNPGGGCLSRIVFLVLVALIAALGYAVYLVSQPQDLSDLKRTDPASPVGRDLKVVLQNALDRGYPLTLSQAELNAWLSRTLESRQKGIFDEKITLTGVWVRLEDEVAEVVMERSLWGHPFTVSMYVQLEKLESVKGLTTEVHLHGEPFHKDFPRPPKGGRFGRLVVPQGFLLLVLPAYEKLADEFAEEIDLAIREMSRVRLEKGGLVLDPREPLGDQGMPKPF